MFLFDDLIRKADSLCSGYDSRTLPVDLEKKYIENENQIIFNDDKAFELGGNPFRGVSLEFLTDQEFDDAIYLYGEDIPLLKKNQSYARITIANIDHEKIGKGNVLYGNIRKFDYVKYHFALDGVMVRESTINRKESLVVSKMALKKGKADFTSLGSYFITKYKSLPFIRNVRMVFVTLPEFDYASLSDIVTKGENITKALDHLMNKVKMDCHSCSLQVICNEVEKKVQEDFVKE